MSQNRREEENGQKETERRRMVEITRLNRKENQTGASCESNLSFLLLKHGQRRAAVNGGAKAVRILRRKNQR